MISLGCDTSGLNKAVVNAYAIGKPAPANQAVQMTANRAQVEVVVRLAVEVCAQTPPHGPDKPASQGYLSNGLVMFGTVMVICSCLMTRR